MKPLTIGCTVVFCQKCRSGCVDLVGWISDTVCELRCVNCGNETRVDGFTFGRYMGDDDARVREAARVDAIFVPAVRP